jgi:hypothetical protein
VPRRQVVITVNSTSPISSGNAPPCGIFGTFAPRNARSTHRKTAPSASAAGQPKRRCATGTNKSVVTAIVPVTAIP